MYKVYHLTRFDGWSFSTRDAALEFVYSKAVPEDYEILDDSDFKNR
jgi:hypothetical protein